MSKKEGPRRARVNAAVRVNPPMLVPVHTVPTHQGPHGGYTWAWCKTTTPLDLPPISIRGAKGRDLYLPLLRSDDS